MAYSLSANERETVIRFDEEFRDTMLVYSASPAIMRKLEKLRENDPDVRLVKEDKVEDKVVSVHYEMPRKYLTIRSKMREKREMTEEQKKIFLANVGKMRSTL